MKKILGILVAALLVAGFAGQASAGFSTFNNDEELIRVVYNTTYNNAGQPQPGTGTYDVITDLGSLSSLLSTVSTSGSVNVGGGVNAYNATSFTVNGSTINTGFATSSNLQVAYFAVNDDANGGNGAAWTSGSQTASLHSTGNYSGMDTVEIPRSLAGVAAYSATGTSTLVFAQSSPFSYQLAVEGLSPGNYSGFLTSTNAFDTEGKVSSLILGGANYQLLYGFLNSANIPQAGTPITATGAYNGDDIGIFTNANGSTTLEAIAPQAPVPIPPSLLLLAPGLLGLVGIRRRLS